MGIYAWLSEYDFERYSKVSDSELDKILQEARSLIPKVYVGESIHLEPRLFRKPKRVVTYQIYSKTSAYGDMEARVLNIACSNKDYVANYLFGLINGYRSAICDRINNKDTQ